MLEKIIKTIPAKDGQLFVISAGQRRPLAAFSGKVEIRERTALVPVLGTVQKGAKSIYATFIVCGDLEYQMQTDAAFINSGKVYEANAEVNNECVHFAGLKFVDSDPLKNELVFEITDLALIEKLLR